MIKPINYNLKNNESDFDISIKEEERWDTESYSDTRIEFSIKVKNNKEQNREIEISNIITYIDKCDGDKLIEMEKIIENNLKMAIAGIIDTPGIHYFTSDSLDFRTKLKRNQLNG
jgi:uncharacterized protein YlxP (DUF503 family)